MSSTRLSINLSTITPLAASGVFIPPRWDDLLEFPGIILNLKADTKMTLTLYESPDAANISSEKIYVVDANESLNLQFNLNSRFFKLKLTNDNLVNNQTYLNLQVIYSQLHTINKDSGSFKIWDNKTLASINTPSSNFKSEFKNSIFTFYGTSSAATVLTVQMSNDNITWYNTQTTYTLSSAGNFGFSVSGVCKYIRLISSAVTTITTYINFKN
jgi:hypothetical protein